MTTQVMLTIALSSGGKTILSIFSASKIPIQVKHCRTAVAQPVTSLITIDFILTKYIRTFQSSHFSSISLRRPTDPLLLPRHSLLANQRFSLRRPNAHRPFLSPSLQERYCCTHHYSEGMDGYGLSVDHMQLWSTPQCISLEATRIIPTETTTHGLPLSSI